MELSWTMKIWTLMVELLLEHVVFLLSLQLEVRLLNGMAAPCLTFWETCQTIFHVTLSFYIPRSNARGEGNWRETTERKPFASACAGIAQLARLMATCVTHSRDGKALLLGDADCGGISLLFSLLLILKAKKQFSFLFFFKIFFWGGSSFLYTQNISNTSTTEFSASEFKSSLLVLRSR